jgi:hypothetical protein
MDFKLRSQLAAQEEWLGLGRVIQDLHCGWAEKALSEIRGVRATKESVLQGVLTGRAQGTHGRHLIASVSQTCIGPDGLNQEAADHNVPRKGQSLRQLDADPKVQSGADLETQFLGSITGQLVLPGC